MNGGDHVLSREGMSLLSEPVSRLRTDEFFQENSIPKSVQDFAVDLQKNLESKSDSKVVQEKWKQFDSASSPVLMAFIL